MDQSQQMTKGQRVTFAIIGVLWVLFMVGKHAQKQDAQRGSDTYAQCAAQAAVKLYLAAPLTAKFSEHDSSRHSDGTWTISGKVTSQNLYGVPMRYFYAAKVVRDSQGYRVDDVWIDNQHYYLGRVCY